MSIFQDHLAKPFRAAVHDVLFGLIADPPTDFYPFQDRYTVNRRHKFDAGAYDLHSLFPSFLKARATIATTTK